MKGLIYIFSFVFGLNTFANAYEGEIQEEDEDIRPIVRSFDYETIELATSTEEFFSTEAWIILLEELKGLRDKGLEDTGPEEDEDIRPISFDYETIELAINTEGGFNTEAWAILYEEIKKGLRDKELEDTEPEEVEIQEVE